MIKHPDHKNLVRVIEISGDMVAVTVVPPLGGGVYRIWHHARSFVERSL